MVVQQSIQMCGSLAGFSCRGEVNTKPMKRYCTESILLFVVASLRCAACLEALDGAEPPEDCTYIKPQVFRYDRCHMQVPVGFTKHVQ